MILSPSWRAICGTRAGTQWNTASNVSAEAGARLRTAVLATRPSAALEIGMAYGVASLYILDALQELDRSGKLTSIDPYQTSQWEGIGVRNLERGGFSDAHDLIEEPDYLALPRLLIAKRRFQFVYIDGNHSLEYVLMNCFYIDQMLDADGVIGFNDTHLAPVRFATWFIVTHRHYREVRFGWEPAYDASSRAGRALRRAVRWQTQDRYFRKVDDWRPGWGDYATLGRYTKVLLGKGDRTSVAAQ